MRDSAGSAFLATMDTKRALREAEESVEIQRAGAYRAPSGRTVSIAEALERARVATASFPPQAALPSHAHGPHDTRYEVTNESTIAAVLRLRGGCALNFASAKNPGGGFLRGTIAQEESLARSSGLFTCLEGHPMYAHHRREGDPLYTSWAIFSPAVPVFRDDAGALLEEPVACSLLTCAAPNAGGVLERDPARRPAVTAALRERIARVLGIAALREERTLILGAWGCGVFENDPVEVAALFHEALHGPFRGAFERVVFAILDSTKERVAPFEERFSSRAT